VGNKTADFLESKRAFHFNVRPAFRSYLPVRSVGRLQALGTWPVSALIRFNSIKLVLLFRVYDAREKFILTGKFSVLCNPK